MLGFELDEARERRPDELAERARPGERRHVPRDELLERAHGELQRERAVRAVVHDLVRRNVGERPRDAHVAQREARVGVEPLLEAHERVCEEQHARVARVGARRQREAQRLHAATHAAEPLSDDDALP